MAASKVLAQRSDAAEGSAKVEHLLQLERLRGEHAAHAAALQRFLDAAAADGREARRALDASALIAQRPAFVRWIRLVACCSDSSLTLSNF